MMLLMLAFLPDSAMIPAKAFAAIALIIGIVSRKDAFGIIGTIILLAPFPPFIGLLLDSLPLWLLIISMVIFFLSMGRLVLIQLLGKGIADIFSSHPVSTVYSFPARLIGPALSRGRRC